MEAAVVMNRKLVAVFSVSGVTKKLAERIAALCDGDFLEIIPETAYTAADLDWKNLQSRSSVEMRDKSSRPAIAAACRVANMEEYDTIYVGFPIWWYVAPTIINTFLEQYDLKGKKIIPFATSGASGMGKTNEELAPSCRGAKLLKGRRFEANVGDEELRAWLAEA